MIVAIGMDPGPTPGMVKLIYTDRKLIDVAVVQCTANTALDFLNLWLSSLPAKTETHLQIEQWVSRGRADAAGVLTRDMVGSAATLAQAHFVPTRIRPAVRAKAWATNDRLARAGLLIPTEGMKHARDAARHALFTACQDATILDPLSRKAG